jgi:hypothetical protein
VEFELGRDDVEFSLRAAAEGGEVAKKSYPQPRRPEFLRGPCT